MEIYNCDIRLEALLFCPDALMNLLNREEEDTYRDNVYLHFKYYHFVNESCILLKI
jgi:hypothetical protein